MVLEMKYKDLEPLINKQFQMIGESIKYKDIPDTGEIVIGKKKMMWYHYYKFPTREMYEKWRKWAHEELELLDRGKEIDEFDGIFGMNWDWTKEFKEKKEGEQLALL